ncbi:MAG: VanZ family protein [Syntrophobacteraceae bacterium]
MPIMVLFLGGFAGIIFWRLSLGSRRESKNQWAVVVFLYALFIYLMSSRSYPGVEMNFDAGYFHPLEYLTLGLLLGRFWYAVLETSGFVSFAIRVMAAGAVLAAFDEIHQAFVPGRYSDLKDFALDLCGLFGSVLIVVAIRRVIGPIRANSRVSE